MDREGVPHHEIDPPAGCLGVEKDHTFYSRKLPHDGERPLIHSNGGFVNT
jgi:hypothetical protein